jgi:hypothetical protein
MKKRQDFLGVKFSSRGWSISSASSGNIGYLSRALSQAVAFLPISADVICNGVFSKLVGAEMIIVKKIDESADDLAVELLNVGSGESFSIKLNRAASRRQALAVGAIVTVRSVSGGYVLLLSGSGPTQNQMRPCAPRPQQ